MIERDVYARLIPIIRELFDDDEIVVRPELTANDVPGWDSMAHVRLMLLVEREFQVRFPAAEVASLANVGDLVSLICRRS
jgi:acyl carrier protein